VTAYGPAAARAEEGGLVAELRLPRLVGARDTVVKLFRDAELTGRIAGDLTVFADDLATGSGSAADELIQQGLNERGAQRLVIVGAPSRFQQRLASAAALRGVADRLVFHHAVGARSRL